MPLRATRSDGADHPGAALKSRLPSLLLGLDGLSADPRLREPSQRQ
jgi:hypothetical protein